MTEKQIIRKFRNHRFKLQRVNKFKLLYGRTREIKSNLLTLCYSFSVDKTIIKILNIFNKENRSQNEEELFSKLFELVYSCLLPNEDKLDWLKTSIDINENNHLLLCDKKESQSIKKVIGERTSLLKFLQYISKQKIPYRKLINIPKEVTIGVEVEYEKSKELEIDEFLIEEVQGWNHVEDVSLCNGGEITSPILGDIASDWTELQELCKFLRNNSVITSKNAGAHIHIGSNIFKSHKHIENFLKTYAAYEEIIFRFLYGDKNTGRDGIYDYAKPIADQIYSFYSVDKEKGLLKQRNIPGGIIDRMRFNFYFLSINLCNWSYFDDETEKDTFEFRAPNGTVDEVIWQNNINMIVKLILATGKDNFDIKAVESVIARDKERDKTKNMMVYEEIDIEKAFEFANLIFETEEDKLYFLKQYFKDFTTNEGYSPIVNNGEKENLKSHIKCIKKYRY